MSRLMMLNGMIQGVKSVEEGENLVKPWVALGGDNGGLGSLLGSLDLTNCSTIQEFVINFMTNKQGSNSVYASAFGVDATRSLKGIAPKTDAVNLEAKLNKGEPTVLACSLGSHEFTIIREGTVYALFQAWESKFHVFPKLNEHQEDHNVIGGGKATIALIYEQVRYIQGKTGCNEQVDAKLAWPRG